jgi:sporulation protein YqfC
MHFKRKVAQILEMPYEVVSEEPKITITGFDEIIIENFIGILEYEEFFVRIKTHIGNVAINGFNLRLTQMNEEDILVKGKIENISFEK